MRYVLNRPVAAQAWALMGEHLGRAESSASGQSGGSKMRPPAARPPPAKHGKCRALLDFLTSVLWMPLGLRARVGRTALDPGGFKFHIHACFTRKGSRNSSPGNISRGSGLRLQGLAAAETGLRTFSNSSSSCVYSARALCEIVVRGTPGSRTLPICCHAADFSTCECGGRLGAAQGDSNKGREFHSHSDVARAPHRGRRKMPRSAIIKAIWRECNLGYSRL